MFIKPCTDFVGDATPGSAQTPGTVKHWAETPVHLSSGSMTPGREPTTPGHTGATPSGRRNRWDETPRGTGGQSLYMADLH